MTVLKAEIETLKLPTHFYIVNESMKLINESKLDFLLIIISIVIKLQTNKNSSETLPSFYN